MRLLNLRSAGAGTAEVHITAIGYDGGDVGTDPGSGRDLNYPGLYEHHPGRECTGGKKKLVRVKYKENGKKQNKTTHKKASCFFSPSVNAHVSFRMDHFLVSESY